MFYVISDELPTVAVVSSLSRAYAFRNKLQQLGYQSSVVEKGEVF